MVQITFIEENGNTRVIDATLGDPLMHSARNAGIEGIIAECGGSAMCATCHCYLKEAPNGPLPEPLADESDTIEFVGHNPTPESRLTCQIIVTEALEGAVFAVATGR